MRNYLWVVEDLMNGEWVAWPSWVRSTRAKARTLQSALREEDSDNVTRVRQYLRREV